VYIWHRILRRAIMYNAKSFCAAAALISILFTSSFACTSQSLFNGTSPDQVTFDFSQWPGQSTPNANWGSQPGGNFVPPYYLRSGSQAASGDWNATINLNQGMSLREGSLSFDVEEQSDSLANTPLIIQLEGPTGRSNQIVTSLKNLGSGSNFV